MKTVGLAILAIIGGFLAFCWCLPVTCSARSSWQQHNKAPIGTIALIVAIVAVPFLGLVAIVWNYYL